MSTSQNGLGSLFAGSGLEDDAVAALDLTADNLGATIMDGLGDVSIDEVEQMGATEVLLWLRLVDDSWSIEQEGNTKNVIAGENLLIDALKGSKASGAILVATLLFNGGLLQPFVTLEHAVRLDDKNYRPAGHTPLYDTVGLGLSMGVAKKAELENGGVAVRCVTNITTDGADVGSRTHRPATLTPIVRGVLASERHIVSAMGIDDGYTDFRAVFRSIGILNQWVLTPGNSASEIRRAYGTVSQSAVRVSQAAGSFSQTAMGGFGTDN